MSAARAGATSRAMLVASTVAAALAMAGALGGPVPAAAWVRAVVALLFLGVGIVGRFIVGSDPRNASGWLMVTCSLGVSAGAFASVLVARTAEVGAIPGLGLIAVIGSLGAAAVVAMATLGLLLFPDGALPSPRWRPVAWAMVALVAMVAVAGCLGTSVVGVDEVANPLAARGAGTAVDVVLLIGIALCAPATALAASSITGRLRRSTEEATRRALLPVVVAAWVFAGSWIVSVPLAAAGMWPSWLGPTADLLLVLFAITAWVGIVRYGLLDVQLVLSQALGYGALTLIVLLVHAGVVWLVGSLVSGVASPGVAIVVAVLATLPLRDTVQRRVNLLVHGNRNDPAAVLTQLGERLGAAATPDDALPSALRTVAGALDLAYAQVDVAGEPIASFGLPAPGACEQVELPFARDVIGHLTVQAATGRIPQTDRAMLARLAPQLAVTARSAVLARALRDSRDRLLMARDDERQRIRRDLHDGLGPTLAAVVLGIEHVGRHLGDDPAAIRRSLDTLHSATQAAIADVRRIVYALRPPALDALGLSAAIQQQAQRLGAAAIDTPTALPEIPAAVENAAYLIALEAMANAAHHAGSAPFRVRLSADDALELDVTDEGPGLPAAYMPGVGISSMRERAAEVGGILVVGARVPRGTSVRARLPLTAEATR